MEKDFTNIVQKIEQRRLVIINALEEEEKALDKTLMSFKENSIKRMQNVLNGLQTDTVEQGKELFKEQKKELRNLRLSFIKTRKMLLYYLLPTALVFGIIIGALGTPYVHTQNPILELKATMIAKGQNESLWYPLTIEEAKRIREQRE